MKDEYEWFAHVIQGGPVFHPEIAAYDKDGVETAHYYLVPFKVSAVEADAFRPPCYVKCPGGELPPEWAKKAEPKPKKRTAKEAGK